MKSTYKLFGTVWDGIEDSNNQMIASKCKQQAEATMVSLSALLRACGENDVEKLLEPFRSSDTITIDMDYHYDGENPVMRVFVEKRERQIKTYLSRMFELVYYCHSSDKKVPSGATNA